MPTPEEFESLRRHHNLTIGLFVAFWICTGAAILAIEVLDLSEGAVNSMMGALGGAVIVAGALQFAKRCPTCGANLGWQVRMGVPDACRKCGGPLKPPKAGDGG